MANKLIDLPGLSRFLSDCRNVFMEQPTAYTSSHFLTFEPEIGCSYLIRRYSEGKPTVMLLRSPDPENSMDLADVYALTPVNYDSLHQDGSGKIYIGCSLDAEGKSTVEVTNITNGKQVALTEVQRLPVLYDTLSINEYYSKPSSGIPATDLAQAVQTTLNNADKITVQYGETDSTKIYNANLCVLTGNVVGGTDYYGTLGLEFDDTPGDGRTFVGYGAKYEPDPGPGWQYPVLLRASYLSSVWSVTELGSYDSLITGVTVNGNVASVSNKVATVNVLPTYSSSDAGKVLRVSSTGTLEWVTPSTIYTGSGTPQQSLGNDGDVYLQTS